MALPEPQMSAHTHEVIVTKTKVSVLLSLLKLALACLFHVHDVVTFYSTTQNFNFYLKKKTTTEAVENIKCHQTEKENSFNPLLYPNCICICAFASYSN